MFKTDKYNRKLSNKILSTISLIFIALFLLTIKTFAAAPPAENPQTGGVGLQGTISAPPPNQAATIIRPNNGQVFRNVPITVEGFCPSDDLIVKIFKNNVFSGAVPCNQHSYNIKIDLFSGRNDLIARVYDALDQAGPDSNIVTITFDDNTSRPEIANKVTLTSNYAKRGANPKELLTWPIIISGGVAPYAISVDWGDGTTNDLYSASFPGEFTIKHQPEQAGVYRMLVKATDKNGTVAYLQLIMVGNGAANQQAVAGASATKDTSSDGTVILWQPAAIAIPLIATTFWLGKRYETKRIRNRLEHGEHPFGK